jgi:hypothetical protein
MSRFDAPTPLQLHLLDLLKQSKASSYAPVSHAAILKQARHRAAPDEIHDALEGLVDRALISTMRHTKDGVTQSVYWPTGLKPITPPTEQERHAMAESKTSRLLRLIMLHGPINGADLAEKANAEGGKIEAKNIQGLLAGHINKGDVVTRKDGRFTLYMASSQADAIAVPPTGVPASHHAEIERRIAELESGLHSMQAEKAQAEADLKGTNEVLAEICRALDARNALMAMAKIEQLQLLSAKATAPVLGYAVMFDAQDMTLHAAEIGARAEAEQLLQGDTASTIHVVAILATARQQVAWQEAA